MSSSRNVSLSEKISNLLTTKPQNSDDEDESHAKLTENITEELSDPEGNEASSFRKYNAALLADLDERYAGKKSSRIKLGIHDGDSSHEVNDFDGNNLIEDEINSNSDVEGGDSNRGSEQGSKSEGESYDQGTESGEDEEGESESGEEADEFQHLDDSKSKDSSKNKGHCVRNQLLIWEGLLEMRIQFQKCLVAANKLPEEHTFSNLTIEKSDFSNKVCETSKTISGALNKLLKLQDAVARQFPETKTIYKVGSSTKRKTLTHVHDDDEEILSDTDVESESIPETVIKSRKKQKVDLNVELNKRHDQYTHYRNSVIQKWNDKTRLAVSKSSINNHSVVNQIEYSLSDKRRLIRKTQLRRSQYKIIGESEQKPDDEENSSRVTEEYNSNIFDDDDFYHHLLRELIEVKSADLTDPVQLGRQWIQLQNLRSKMKRKIDTRATKGRKIRYAVHSKLVNFMAPIDDSVWTNEAKNELYSSIFGKKVS